MSTSLNAEDIQVERSAITQILPTDVTGGDDHNNFDFGDVDDDDWFDPSRDLDQ
jgi:hypothetical protein